MSRLLAPARWAPRCLVAIAVVGASSVNAEGLVLNGPPTALAGPGFVAASVSTPAGEIELVWDSSDADGSGVFARRYSAEGLPLGERQPLNQKTDGYQLYPAVTTLASGFVATWETMFPIFFPFLNGTLQVGEDHSISARILDRFGAPQGAELRLNSENTFGVQARVAGLASGGFVASWARISSPAGLVFRLFDASGEPQTAEILFAPSGHAINVSLVGLPGGGFAAAWDHAGLFVQCFGADGAPLGGPSMISDAGGGVPAALATNDQGDLAFAWMSAFSTMQSFANIFVTRLGPTGAPLWTPVVAAESNPNGKPTLGGVDIDALGRVTVSWTRGLGSPQIYTGDAFAQIFDASGAAQGEPVRINQPGDGVQIAGAVLGARDGFWRVLWHDSFDGTDWVQRVRAADCAGDPASLCVQEGRFRLAASYVDPRTQQRATAHPWEMTSDTGAFSFFGADNAELVVKVLDGREVNGRFWVFYGALSDVAYDLTVTDTLTGEQRAYHNAAGTLASRADTQAFPIAASTSAFAELPSPAAAKVSTPGEPPSALAETSCAHDMSTLCLGGGRFSLDVAWHDVRSGLRGTGRAVPLSSESGYFWFFAPGNVELVVKVLDGTPVNGHVWVFYASLTDVEFDLTVTDNASTPANSRVYHNPAGTLASAADVTAF